MRLFETLLFLANLFILILWAVSLPRAVHWMRHSAPIALLVAIAQMLVEGPRWQMIPAYVLTGLLVLVWLRQNTVTASGPVGQKRAHRLFVGLGILGLAVSVALPIALPVFRFSHPSGPCEIGTLTYHWVDADRPEIFTADPNAHRELMVQIWYPAKAASSSPRALRAGRPRSRRGAGTVETFSGVPLRAVEIRDDERHYVRTRGG